LSTLTVTAVPGLGNLLGNLPLIAYHFEHAERPWAVSGWLSSSGIA
jgi:hypothetical protein